MGRDYFNEEERWVTTAKGPLPEEREVATPPPRRKPRVSINIILFILTVGTTLFAGALHQGVDPLRNPSELIKGLPFSAALLFILLAHEMGHYLTSKRYHIDATLPYFIPAPTIIGTFGALIKMRSPIYGKRVLFDIGVAGPLAGVVVTIPILIIGLKFSLVKELGTPLEGEMMLGTSLFLSMMTKMILGNLPDSCHIILHPLGFAGWIGLLVTSLNLMPVGQLDGGHIAYAVLGRKAELVSRLVLVALLGLGLAGAHMWMLWAILLIFIMRVKHPVPLDYDIPLDRKREIIGIIMLILFIVTFIPFPFGKQ